MTATLNADLVRRKLTQAVRVFALARPWAEDLALVALAALVAREPVLIVGEPAETEGLATDLMHTIAGSASCVRSTDPAPPADSCLVLSELTHWEEKPLHNALRGAAACFATLSRLPADGESNPRLAPFAVRAPLPSVGLSSPRLLVRQAMLRRGTPTDPGPGGVLAQAQKAVDAVLDEAAESDCIPMNVADHLGSLLLQLEERGLRPSDARTRALVRVAVAWGWLAGRTARSLEPDLDLACFAHAFLRAADQQVALGVLAGLSEWA